MFQSTSRLGTSRMRASLAVIAALSLAAAACSSDDDASSDSSPPATTPTATAAPETGENGPVDTEPPVDTAPDDSDAPTSSDDPGEAFPNLDPPTREPIVIGLVNTEGTPGLDFPAVREAISGSMDYLNEHGGFGGRHPHSS